MYLPRIVTSVTMDTFPPEPKYATRVPLIQSKRQPRSTLKWRFLGETEMDLIEQAINSKPLMKSIGAGMQIDFREHIGCSAPR
jgi:hypothetical protein